LESEKLDFGDNGSLSRRCFSVAIILSYKVRILAVTVTSLSLMPRADALPAELNYFLQTASPQNVTKHMLFLEFPTDWVPDLSVILLLVMIFAVILVKSVRRHKKRLYEFDLYLHVGFDTEACEIWIKKFKL